MMRKVITPSSYLDAHSLQIVQGIEKANHVAAMSHLIGVQVMLIQRSIDVIVGWVTIHKPIQKQRVHGKAPVVRRGMVGVVGPLTPVLHWVCCRLIFVDVV